MFIAKHISPDVLICKGGETGYTVMKKTKNFFEIIENIFDKITNMENAYENFKAFLRENQEK